jgi:hypothetical protein
MRANAKRTIARAIDNAQCWQKRFCFLARMPHLIPKASSTALMLAQVSYFLGEKERVPTHGLAAHAFHCTCYASASIRPTCQCGEFFMLSPWRANCRSTPLCSYGTGRTSILGARHSFTVLGQAWYCISFDMQISTAENSFWRHDTRNALAGALFAEAKSFSILEALV